MDKVPKEVLNDAIKSFDLIDFLDRESLDYSLEGKNIGQGWIGISPCPSCGDGKNHFAIHQETKNYNCWVCGTKGGLISFISKVKDISKSKAVQIICENATIEVDDVEQTVQNILNPSITNTVTNTEKKNGNKVMLPPSITISKNILKKHLALQSFFKDRRMSLCHAQFYGLRLGAVGSKFHGMLVFPITYKGRIVAFQARTVRGRKEYISEGNLKQYLYRVRDIPKQATIIVVEGILDYINLQGFLYKYKLPYITTTPFSKILSAAQINMLNELHPKKVIFMLDRDAWFQYNDVAHSLCCDTDFIILPTGRDPGSLSEKEMLKIMTERTL